MDKKCLVAFIISLIMTSPCRITAEPRFADAVFGGSVDVVLRTYYMHRIYDISHEREAMSAGGWIGYETKWWRNLKAGFSFYTSQGLFFTDADDQGTYLLGPDQKEFSVLGKAFLEGKLSKTSFRLFRQELDTPLLNSNDYRMIPITMEAYTIESREIENLVLYASRVTKIKSWNDNKFRYMSSAAGYPGTNDPVDLVGMVFSPKSEFKIQLWDYYCYDIMNMVYFQSDFKIKFSNEIELSPSLQFLYQKDIGDILAGPIKTAMGGVQAVLGWKGLELTLGYSAVDGKNGVADPWGIYPGFTAAMVLDNDRAREKTWLAGLSYDFSGVGLTGLSAYTLYTDSKTPDFGSNASPDAREIDFNIGYRFPKPLEGLKIRLRSGYITQDKALGGEDIKDYRVIINYTYSIL